jgi:hypothetical protein
MSKAKEVAEVASTNLWASPKSAYYDLGEAMDALYGAGVWTSSSDASPAATTALQALRSRYGRGVLRLTGASSWTFNSGLAAADLSGNFVEGYGELASRITFTSSNSTLFHFTGVGGFNGGGIKNLGATLQNGLGNTTSYFVRVDGTSSNQNDQMEFENIYTTVGAGSTWFRGGSFDGTARTSPQGIRVFTIKNWQQFSCNNMAFLFWNVVQASADNIGSYTGIGSGNDIVIGGGGTSSTNTTQFSLTNVTCGGDLNLTNATDCRISGKATTVSVASSFNDYDVFVNAGSSSGTPGANGRWLII